jgi:hypothetical protein
MTLTPCLQAESAQPIEAPVDSTSLLAAVPEHPVFQFVGGLSGQQVSWRLVAANHREVGRSAMPFASVEQATLAIKYLQGDRVNFEKTYSSTPDHRWHWAVMLGGEVLAISIRSFDRRLRCVMAAERFLDLATSARIAAHTAIRPKWGASGSGTNF